MTYIGYIYILKHEFTGRVYVGQTTQKPVIRLDQHNDLLLQGKHHSYMMQADYDDLSKHIKMKVIDTVKESTKEALKEKLNQLEAQYIEHYNARYNTDWPHVDGIQHIKRDRGKVIPYKKEQKLFKKKHKKENKVDSTIDLILTTIVLFCVALLIILGVL